MIEDWEYTTECEACFHVLARHDDDARCTVTGCKCRPKLEAPEPSSMAECPKCLHAIARHNRHGDCTACGIRCFDEGLDIESPSDLVVCPVCKSEIPDAAYSTHLENCKAAYYGYFGRGAFRA